MRKAPRFSGGLWGSFRSYGRMMNLCLAVLAILLGAGVVSAEPSPAASTLTGKLVVGYQGWFSTPGDGSQLNSWFHWGFRKDTKAPDAATRSSVELWPDMSEYSAEERFATPLGAEVFSSHNPKTVQRHFHWLKQYGIDAAFVQRFGGVLRDPRFAAFTNGVLTHCRQAAEAAGRAFCVMYDLSGLKAGDIDRIVRPDWEHLRRETKITNSPAYQHHGGRPVVAVWGVGFNDGRAYTLAECEALVTFLKADGCRVFLGVPYWWRVGKNDTVADPALLPLLAKADFVSPWAVGRFRTPGEVEKRHAENVREDLAWCQEKGIGYAPVMFPGFSWRNLQAGRGKTEKLNAIPRLGGEFLWSQVRANVSAGAQTVYLAMFDEVDEGTAIFKCTNAPPRGPDGAELFLTYEGLPTDHYLWLAGQAGRALRKETTLAFPSRHPGQK